MQEKLFDEYDDDIWEKTHKVNIGTAARNATYRMIKPDLPDKRQRVYEAILLLTSSEHPNGVTRKQIAKHLGWPINCVTGRVTELRDIEHLIVEEGTELTPCYDGRVYPNGVLKPL